jgi:ribonuclease D
MPSAFLDKVPSVALRGRRRNLFPSILPAVAEWIRTPDALARLGDELRGSRALAIDSESDSLYHHFDKVCLIQLATDGGRAVLIDPLVVRDLQVLAPLMADPEVTKVFHGADYDVTTLKRDFGFSFAGVFDTMLAARFLGLPEIGLQAVVRRELGVELSKGSQKDDWSRRPLTPTQEAYALADVQHLLEIRARLEEQLRAVGRLAWLEEECGAVAALDPARRRKDKDAYQKVKGARRLSPRALAILRELVSWREARAEGTDTPAFKILGNETLLAMAAAAPRTRDDLSRLRLPSRLFDHAPDLLRAVERASDLPERDLPQIPREPRPVVSDEARRRSEKLKAWRTKEAEALKLDPSVILPQRLIDRLAESAIRDVSHLKGIEGLRRWRIEAFGPALLSATQGG